MQNMNKISKLFYLNQEKYNQSCESNQIGVKKKYIYIYSSNFKFDFILICSLLIENEFTKYEVS